MRRTYWFPGFLVVLGVLLMLGGALARASPAAGVAESFTALQTVPPETTPNNMLTTLGLMAASVTMLMELIKKGGLSKLATESGWSDGLYAFVCLLLSFILSLVLIYFAPATLTIFAAAHLTAFVPELLARVVTALVIAMGNVVLHAAYDFLQTAGTVVYVTSTNPTIQTTEAQGVRPRPNLRE